MRKSRSRWGAVATVVVFVVLLLACGIRQDEFSCEDAVSHLVQCCPGFTGNNVYCEYESGCGSATYPDLDVDQSSCIRSESCDVLRSTGVCDRASRLVSSGGGAVTVSYDATPPPPSGSAPDITGVCP